MEALLFLLLFPIVWPFIAKRIWDRDITWLELGLNIGIIALLVTGVWQAGRYGKMSDTEIWNGQVTSKEQTYVSCSHSYSCNCRKTCDSSGNCPETCDTCYDHFNDWDWDVYTTAGNFTVSRVDRQGSDTPPRWAQVRVGDPSAREHSFVNYIKAAPDSLFHFSSELIGKNKELLPEYPSVFDYQYADRVFARGLLLPETTRWNKELALMLRNIGPSKQANAIVVVVKTGDQKYAQALEQHWLGGKKNDVVVILGVPEYPKISWAYVMSWTKRELFKVELRDALIGLGQVDNTPVIQTIEKHISKNFVRRQMSEFEYLKNEIDPPSWVIVIVTILATGGSIALSLVFRQTDIGR